MYGGLADLPRLCRVRKKGARNRTAGTHLLYAGYLKRITAERDSLFIFFGCLKKAADFILFAFKNNIKVRIIIMKYEEYGNNDDSVDLY